jgi:DNA-binding response OmpR family regulator
MHILILEDDKGISILNQALEEEGYLASVASDALKGFERLKNTFNLIVEDWMPKITGLELCKAIKINYSSISILF